MPRKGDVNGDGVKDFNDIQMFTDKLLGTDNTLASGETYSGDYIDWSGDNNGVKDGRDVQGFVQNYLAP